MERERGRFEDGFGNVVLIPAVQIFNVQIEAALLHRRLKKFFDQLRLKIADARGLEFRLIYKVRPSGEINHHAGESFVQGNMGVPKADDSTALAQRFAKRLPENPTHIFNRMVPVDFEITFCLDLEIKMAMPRDLRQHVVEKRNSGLNPVFARAIKIKAHADIRFVRLPKLRCFSRFHQFVSSTRSSAARNLSFSSGVPIETRKHRSSSGYALTSRTSTPWL